MLCCLALVSRSATSILPSSVDFTTIILGEVGLSSEVRSVSQIAVRINEAEKLGFKKCIIPQNNLKVKSDFGTKTIEVIPVSTVTQALDVLEITS